MYPFAGMAVLLYTMGRAEWWLKKIPVHPVNTASAGARAFAGNINGAGMAFNYSQAISQSEACTRWLFGNITAGDILLVRATDEIKPGTQLIPKLQARQ